MTPADRRDGVVRKGMKTARTERQKKIALVAHDSKKNELLEWARHNKMYLSPCTPPVLQFPSTS